MAVWGGWLAGWAGGDCVHISFTRAKLARPEALKKTGSPRPRP